jgi:very-short-patch-repair endonuclease
MKYYVCVEADVIKCILKTFDGNIMTLQYKVDEYRIDLYFEQHKLAIECDENHHNSIENKLKDIQRERYIYQKIKCRFIRFNPNDKKFNLFELLNEIYIHLAVSHRDEVYD